MTDLPPIVMKAYDLALWLLPRVNGFPRSCRFTLGDRLETRMSRNPFVLSRS
ncbi:MAG: hypothetical protein HZA21_05030 [Nitrospirae bacterium]|nr:hypothetical protein [Nitrospirota bacterium]